MFFVYFFDPLFFCFEPVQAFYLYLSGKIPFVFFLTREIHVHVSACVGLIYLSHTRKNQRQTVDIRNAAVFLFAFSPENQAYFLTMMLMCCCLFLLGSAPSAGQNGGILSEKLDAVASWNPYHTSDPHRWVPPNTSVHHGAK